MLPVSALAEEIEIVDTPAEAELSVSGDDSIAIVEPETPAKAAPAAWDEFLAADSVAMTGEVSLQGDVNPIGGLPEKLMAAQRSGVRQVFIPRDNLDDLKDVDEEVKAALTITPVDSVEDVQQALGIPVRSNLSLVG